MCNLRLCECWMNSRKWPFTLEQNFYSIDQFYFFIHHFHSAYLSSFIQCTISSKLTSVCCCSHCQSWGIVGILFHPRHLEISNGKWSGSFWSATILVSHSELGNEMTSYTLNQLMQFEAANPSMISGPGNQRIYIDECFVTASLDPNSPLQYKVIDNYGWGDTADQGFWRFEAKRVVFLQLLDRQQGVRVHVRHWRLTDKPEVCHAGFSFQHGLWRHIFTGTPRASANVSKFPGKWDFFVFVNWGWQMSFSNSTCTVCYPMGVLLQARLPRLARMIPAPRSKLVFQNL